MAKGKAKIKVRKQTHTLTPEGREAIRKAQLKRWRKFRAAKLKRSA